jgi:hypothetical protein
MAGRTTVRAWVAAALAAGLLAAGCGTTQGACKDDYNCDGTEVCKKSTGKCEPVRCRADKDCLDPTLQCIDNDCVKAGTVTPADVLAGDAVPSAD